MPLPWVRLDTTFPHNRKLLRLLRGREGHRAGLVYVCGLSWCGAQGTDGFIDAEALPFIHGRKADAQRLVDAELWESKPGGWYVHDWPEFQESNEATQKRSEKAQRAAQKRWAQEQLRKHPPEDQPGLSAVP